LHALRDAMQAKVAEWAKDNVIIPAPANCGYNNPLTCAPKKDEHGNKVGVRVCLETRLLNAKIKDDRYPLPVIQDILSSLGGAKVFTTLDLKESFHQMPLRKQDQEKTAFTWNNRHWMFRGAPFGLKVLSSHFQRVMNAIFLDMPFVLAYIDDIVVFSKDEKEHEEHVRKAIQRLSKYNLRIRRKKCHFGRTQ